MRRSNRRAVATLLPAIVLGAMLGGCSDYLYLDRRDSIAFNAGDAPHQNVAVHTVDPWPPAASNRKLTTNGELMQKAAERYRTNKTTPLKPMGTSSVQMQASPGSGTSAGTPGSP
jgi:hypothetical protein